MACAVRLHSKVDVAAQLLLPRWQHELHVICATYQPPNAKVDTTAWNMPSNKNCDSRTTRTDTLSYSNSIYLIVFAMTQVKVKRYETVDHH
eukprot:6467096-Amphidinium_carterae.1